MAYWVQDDDDEFFRQFRRQPTNLPGMLSRAEVVELLLRAHRLLGDAGAVALLRGLRAVPARRDRAADLLPLLPQADLQRGLRDLRPGRAAPRAALQRDHRRAREWGRSCWSGTARRRGTPTTTTCSRRSGGSSRALLGEALAARGIEPDVVVHGGMRRHRETAEACLRRAGRRRSRTEVDPGWDEFDHLAMLATHPAPFEGEPHERGVPGVVRGGHRRAGPPASTTRTTPSRSPPSPSGSRPRCVVRPSGTGTARRVHHRRPDRLAVPPACSPTSPTSPPAVAPAQPGLRELRRHPARHRPPRHHPGHLQRARPPRRPYPTC